MRITGVDWALDVRYHDKSFAGRVVIAIEEAPDPLVVDAAQLIVQSATVDDAPVTYRVDRARGTLEFPGIGAGPHRLEIAYQGAADENSLVGMYVSPSGPGYVLTTMAFPTGARRILPSFEHPAVKTVYRLTLTVEEDARVIFNTAFQTERKIDGRRELVFEPTPPMSAYLLYLCIGPFEALAVPGERWPVTVATSPGRSSAGRYSAERAAELLAGYEEYYAMPYPLSKLDLVALENFWAGAMENWGAISFRENALLVDPTTSVRARREVLLILAHEIAHQWFGNLVTAAWWDDFWLNESFATFVGYRMVSRLYPEEDAWSHFLLRWAGPAFEQDALSASHPIHVPVNSPEEVGENADAVTYGKGGAVLRMIEAYLGEETFRRGVSHYLAKYRYANARSEDLWAALGEVSDRPVGRIMAEWINRPGHPIVHAAWTDGELHLRQERFRADGGPSPGVWPIPLRISSSAGERVELFEREELTISLGSPKGLRIDPERAAFARVHYDSFLFDQMVDEFPSATPVDQWGFIMDTHAFVYAELVPLGRFFGLLHAGDGLSEPLPVRALTAALSDLYAPLHDVPAFVTSMRQFLRAQLDRVGLEPRSKEADSAPLLREVLAVSLCQVDPAFARQLAVRFAEFDRLPAELRGPVALAYARAEGSAAYDPLVRRLQATTSEGERVQIVLALASFTDGTLVRRALDLITTSVVTAGTAFPMLLSAAANPASRRALFAWYRNEATELSKMWAGTPLHSLFLRIGVPMLGIDQEAAVEEYFATHTPADASQAVRQGLESLHLVMRLRRSVRGVGPP
jgi:tricorn protease interacting factor F2/3